MIVLGTGLTVSSGRRAPRPLPGPPPCRPRRARPGPTPPGRAAPASERGLRRARCPCGRGLWSSLGAVLCRALGRQATGASPGVRACSSAQVPVLAAAVGRPEMWTETPGHGKPVLVDKDRFSLCWGWGVKKKIPIGLWVLLHLRYGLTAPPDWKRKSTRQRGGGWRPLSGVSHSDFSHSRSSVFGCQSQAEDFVTSHRIITVLCSIQLGRLRFGEKNWPFIPAPISDEKHHAFLQTTLSAHFLSICRIGNEFSHNSSIQCFPR